MACYGLFCCASEKKVLPDMFLFELMTVLERHKLGHPPTRFWSTVSQVLNYFGDKKYKKSILDEGNM